MGQTQFMPSSFLAYAVDFEGHGRRDIWTSAPDAIGSTANYLAGNGWTRDLPWGFEVTLPPGFALTDADSARAASVRRLRRPRRAARRRQAAARRRRRTAPDPGRAQGADLPGHRQLRRDQELQSSTAYALAVALLGDAIRGGTGLVAPWPRSDVALKPDEVRNLQLRLKQMGYDPGDIDGMVGEALRGAVRKYQERTGLPPDGYADAALLKRIEATR